MQHSTLGALSLILLLTGAAEIDRPPASAPPDLSPRLQLTRLAGKLEIELGERAADPSARALPLLRPGSLIRVVTGWASFEADLHATVRAVEGTSFRFESTPPAEGRPAALVITAGAIGLKGLEVAVGDRKFRLRRKGSLSITEAWPGEVVVKSESYGVQHAPGGLGDDGAFRTGLRRMPPGDAVLVLVPEGRGFDDSAMAASALKIEQRGRDTLVVVAAPDGSPARRVRDAYARRMIASWPVVSLRTAEAVMEKHGPPDLAVSDRLVWYDNGAWKITTVYRDPAEHGDVLEQTIGYAVPQDKTDALARLDLALRLSRDRRSLSAVSESEETNVLALNLADEVVRDKRTPEEARALYLKTVVLANAGKSSPYMEKLLFR